MSSHISIFLVVQLLLICSDFKVFGIQIDVNSRPQFQGQSTSLNVSECLGTLPPHLNNSFESVNTHNHCVHLYKREYCRGPYLIVSPGSPAHEELKWYGFNYGVKSIGPCFNACHSDKVVSVNSSSDVVTTAVFYSRSDETILQEVRVAANACVDMTEGMATWHTDKFRVGLDTDACLELHEFADCSGHTQQLHVGRETSQSQVTYWPGSQKVASISFCGYKCELPDEESQNETLLLEPEGVATFFLRDNFEGDKTTLNLTGCTPLPTYATNKTIPWKSLILYGSCVNFYKDVKCVGSPTVTVVGAAGHLHSIAEDALAIQTCPYDEPAIQHFYCSGSAGDSSDHNSLVIVAVLLLIGAMGVMVGYGILVKVKQQRGLNNGNSDKQTNNNAGGGLALVEYNRGRGPPTVISNGGDPRLFQVVVQKVQGLQYDPRRDVPLVDEVDD